MFGTIRWAMTDGLVRAELRRQRRAGHPDALILGDREHRDEPFAVYDAMRTDAPFVDGALGPMSLHHDVCTEILRRPEFHGIDVDEAVPPAVRRFLRRLPPAPPGPLDRPSMLVVDGARHALYRRLVTRTFTARAMDDLRGRTGQVADGLLDGLEERFAGGADPVDLVEHYAAALPIVVISEILGVPAGMREQVLRWGDQAASSLNVGLGHRESRAAHAGLAALNTWLREHLRRLRREPDGGLLASLVAATDDEGAPLTESELVATAQLLLLAGFETTVNLIGNGTAALFAHPDQRRLLADDPSWWPNAVEEILRLESPVQRTFRRATRDVTVGATPVARGDMVGLVLGAANRDPAVFTDPHTFDVTRANARQHLSFASGPHFCVGAHLARMEGEVALRALFERFTGLEPSGPPRRRPTMMLRGYSEMGVRVAVRGAPAPAA